MWIAITKLEIFCKVMYGIILKDHSLFFQRGLYVSIIIFNFVYKGYYLQLLQLQDPLESILCSQNDEH